MSCGELFLKGASSTFTGYFLIVSVAFIFYGLTTTIYLLKTNSVEVLDHELVAVPSLSLSLIGLILLIAIIIGCCGVCREIPCCLESYSVLLALLASAQVAVGIFSILGFTNEEFRSKMEESVIRMFNEYDVKPGQMDSTQQWIKCCGVMDFNDWLHNHSIPASCCEGWVYECTVVSGNIFPAGCAPELFDFVVSTNYMIGLTLIVTAITELIGAVMGIGLSCAFWRNQRVMWI